MGIIAGGESSEGRWVIHGDALHIYVYPEDSAYIGEQYYVKFKLTNESDIPVYNVKTSFEQYTEATPVQEVIVVGFNGSKTKLRSTPTSDGFGYSLLFQLYLAM